MVTVHPSAAASVHRQAKRNKINSFPLLCSWHLVLSVIFLLSIYSFIHIHKVVRRCEAALGQQETRSSSRQCSNGSHGHEEGFAGADSWARHGRYLVGRPLQGRRQLRVDDPWQCQLHRLDFQEELPRWRHHRVQVPTGHPQRAGGEEGRLRQLHQLDADRHAHLRRRQDRHQEPRPPLLHLRRARPLRRRPEDQHPRPQDALLCRPFPGARRRALWLVGAPQPQRQRRAERRIGAAARVVHGQPARRDGHHRAIAQRQRRGGQCRPPGRRRCLGAGGGRLHGDAALDHHALSSLRLVGPCA